MIDSFGEGLITDQKIIRTKQLCKELMDEIMLEHGPPKPISRSQSIYLIK